MKRLFIAWQDPSSRSWFPIGRLTVNEGSYRFQYIRGALNARKNGFEPLRMFPDIYQSYESDELFPIFAKRVLSPTRPEYSDFVDWLGLAGTDVDPVELLARSGGKSVTDRFEVFPYPEKTDDNKYHCHFFAHGLRHLPGEAIERINHLRSHDRLYLANEFQNPVDQHAMILCTEDHWHVGYCPRYLFHEVEKLSDSPEKVIIEIEKDVSESVPLQFRLLCNLTAFWDESELPFNKGSYRPVTYEQSYPRDSDTPKLPSVCNEGDI